MLDRIRREPALVTELVRAILLCAVVFGLPLTDVQTAAVLLVVGAFMAIAVRQQVTPTVAVEAIRTPDGDTEAGPAADLVDEGDPAVVFPDEAGHSSSTLLFWATSAPVALALIAFIAAGLLGRVS